MRRLVLLVLAGFLIEVTARGIFSASAGGMPVNLARGSTRQSQALANHLVTRADGLSFILSPAGEAIDGTAEIQPPERLDSTAVKGLPTDTTAVLKRLLDSKTQVGADRSDPSDPDFRGPADDGLLPTSGSEPQYEPQAWNHAELIAGNNCYAYACDDLDPHRRDLEDFPQPGNTAGLPSAAQANYCVPLLRLRAIADGLIPVLPPEEDAPPPAGFYKVALFVAPCEDYHWYRQDADGHWSHKLGDGPVLNIDADGHSITDPRAAGQNYTERVHLRTGEPSGFNYTQFGGFFYVPEGGLRLRGMPVAAR